MSQRNAAGSWMQTFSMVDAGHQSAAPWCMSGSAFYAVEHPHLHELHALAAAFVAAARVWSKKQVRVRLGSCNLLLANDTGQQYHRDYQL